MNTFLFITLILLSAQDGSKKKPEVVDSVNLAEYAGKWYEIARLPNRFERKLKCITATYTLRRDGKITVLNEGHYITDPSRKNSARGMAWIPDQSETAKLKVQFFWPFAGDYWIMDLDKDYRYVLVGEPSFKYLWILAREKTMNESVFRRLLQKAVDNGYDVGSIIKVDHDCE
jgi:lipocalin